MNKYIVASTCIAALAAFAMASGARADTVFSTGFEYSGGAPTVGTDVADLNGADAQAGSFSGTIPNGLMSFTTANGGNLLSDGHSDGAGATADWKFRATLSTPVELDGATVSFDYGTRRTQGNHDKDNFIVGYDLNSNEVFRLVVSASTTVGSSKRLGYVDAADTTTWDLPGAADADNDVPFTSSAVNRTISLNLSAAGFTIALSEAGGADIYTSSEIAFNGGSDLAYLEFEGQGGGDDTFRSGFYLDDIAVSGTPYRFYTGFEYAGGAPTVGTDAADLNGADAQAGSFSGTIPNSLMSFTTANGGNLLSDGHSDGAGATADWKFRAMLSTPVELDGATVSFDYGTRRIQPNHNKDNFIVGYDLNSNEVFRLVVSADTTAGSSKRLGYVDAVDTTTWDLPGAADGDGNVPNTAAGVNKTISLSLSAAGFTITLSDEGGADDYTTSKIAYNGGSGLAYLEFEGRGGIDDTFRSGFFLDDIAVSGTPYRFYTGFEYSGGAPTVGTDAADLNGADVQAGSFSGTIPNSLMSFTTANGGNLLSDGHSDGAGATADWKFRAMLSTPVELDGATVSFDYGTRRIQANHNKDNFIVGYDLNSNEVFRLVVSADTTTVGSSKRLGYVDAADATTWDLPGAADADDDVPFASSAVNRTISLSLSATGFTIALSEAGGADIYTSSEIAFNGGSDLAYLEFEGQGGGDDTFRSGFYLDDVTVLLIPPPAGTLFSFR